MLKPTAPCGPEIIQLIEDSPQHRSIGPHGTRRENDRLAELNIRRHWPVASRTSRRDDAYYHSPPRNGITKLPAISQKNSVANEHEKLHWTDVVQRKTKIDETRRKIAETNSHAEETTSGETRPKMAAHWHDAKARFDETNPKLLYASNNPDRRWKGDRQPLPPVDKPAPSKKRSERGQKTTVTTQQQPHDIADNAGYSRRSRRTDVDAGDSQARRQKSPSRPVAGSEDVSSQRNNVFSKRHVGGDLSKSNEPHQTKPTDYNPNDSDDVHYEDDDEDENNAA